MKCATTSLHYYLDAHPDIYMSSVKELNFFSTEWHRGHAWYAQQFSGRHACNGESSPGYSADPLFPGVPLRMHAVVPSAKLVYLVRDPIDRMVSHFVHDTVRGKEHRDLETALLASEPNDYLIRSRYGYQLSRYTPYYPTDRILIVETEKLATQQRAELRRLFTFFGVDPDVSRLRFRFHYHAGRRRRLTPRGIRLASSPAADLVRAMPPWARGPISRAVAFPFTRPYVRPELSPALLSTLRARLRADTLFFREQTGVSLKLGGEAP